MKYLTTVGAPPGEKADKTDSVMQRYVYVRGRTEPYRWWSDVKSVLGSDSVMQRCRRT